MNVLMGAMVCGHGLYRKRITSITGLGQDQGVAGGQQNVFLKLKALAQITSYF